MRHKLKSFYELGKVFLAITLSQPRLLDLFRFLDIVNIPDVRTTGRRRLTKVDVISVMEMVVFFL